MKNGKVLFRVCIPSEHQTELVLSTILSELKVNNPLWVQCIEKENDAAFKQVLFYLENGSETEEAIKLLTEHGIGFTPNSSIGLFQCYLHYGFSNETSPKGSEPSPAGGIHSWETFLDSIRPGLAIAHIIESVKRKANLTFDFLVLLVVAALTASLGLVEDNQLILAASMLISPMMFPMIATTLGTVINQWKLKKLGLVNGLIGLVLCVIIGFAFGIIVSFVQGKDISSEWPTTLMQSMGTTRSLWTGAILAILSGTAIGVVILGDNPGSIHGVAISAALLPPAVNAGLLWSRSVLSYFIPEFPSNVNAIWSPSPVIELAIHGWISLALSFLNVIFIFITGHFLLKIKEVSIRAGRTDPRWETFRQFQTISKEEAEHITNRIEELNPRHHWTVCSDIYRTKEFARTAKTWSGRIKPEERPTVREMVTRLAPNSFESDGSFRSNMALGVLQGSSPNLHEGVNSRFTVIPVSSSEKTMNE